MASTPPPHEPDEGLGWVAPGTPPGPGVPTPGWQGPPVPRTPPGWQAPPGWGSPGYQPPVQLPKAGGDRTGPLPLHPMTFGDVLDGAFRLLKANLATIVLISAAFFVPLELLSAFFSRDVLGGHSILDFFNDPSLLDQEASAGTSTLSLVGTYVTYLLGLVFTPLVGGAVTKVVAASYLGETLPPGEAFGAIGRRLWALLGAAICVHLLELVGLVACLVGALVPMTFYVCTTPALIVEGLGPIKAMGRSAALVRPRFWPVLGIVVVSTVLSLALTYVLRTPFTVAAGLIGLHWGFILIALGSILPVLVVSPFVAIVATLVYFDGRIRQEGFDLQMIARDLGHGTAPAG